MNFTLIVTGPSGVGKTYLAQELQRLYPSQFKNIKLYTTRKRRSSDADYDRVFVSPKEFSEKEKKGEFFFAGLFHNSQYGYAKESLIPTNKHLIVNAWPAIITNFLTLPNVLFIGLTIADSQIKLLEQRMELRGDSKQAINERKNLIKQDVLQINKNESIINNQGKLFCITSDKSIPTVVIPWIQQTLKL